MKTSSLQIFNVISINLISMFKIKMYDIFAYLWLALFFLLLLFFLKWTEIYPQLSWAWFFVSTVIALCDCAGVAEFRGCSAANGGGGLGAPCSWKEHAARVGEPGHWWSASSGEVNINKVSTCSWFFSNIACHICACLNLINSDAKAPSFFEL